LATFQATRIFLVEESEFHCKKHCHRLGGGGWAYRGPGRSFDLLFAPQHTKADVLFTTVVGPAAPLGVDKSVRYIDTPNWSRCRSPSSLGALPRTGVSPVLDEFGVAVVPVTRVYSIN